MTLPAAAQPSPTSAGVNASTERPPINPADWTLSNAQNVVAGQTPSWIKTARRFVVDGDHWQEGTGWIGPMPLPGSRGYAETHALIKDGFTFRNAVAEISKRYTNGVVGNEPDWSLTPIEGLEAGEDPSPEDQTLIDEAEAALTEWWDREKIAPLFWQACYQMAWGQRGPIRLFLSRAGFVEVKQDTNGDVTDDETKAATTARAIPQKGTLGEALDVILLDVPKIEEMAVYVDPDTHQEVGVYLFKTREGNDAAEISYVDGDAIVIRNVGAKTDTFRVQLGEHLPHYQMLRPTRLLTDAAFSLQRALNLALSVVPRTIVTAGFLERVLLNAKMPGKWVEIAGKAVWQPEPNLGFGAGSTASVTGLEAEDGQGKTIVKDPSVVWRPPVDSGPSVDAADKIYGTLLAETGQGHIMLAAEAAPSGRSRREARADYESSLNEGTQPIESAGRWLLGAVLALCEHLMGQPGKYTKRLRPVFNLLPDAGPLEPEDRQQNLLEWKDGARSLESVMLGAGIKDPDAEQARIGQEQGARLELLRRQAEVAQLWIDLGAGVDTAGNLVGLDPTLIAKLKADRKLLEQQTQGDPGTGGAGGTDGDREEDDGGDDSAEGNRAAA